MITYENNEHNVNMLVERQEEPETHDYYYSEVYSLLNVTEKEFDDNIELINEKITECLNNGMDEQETALFVESFL